MKKGGRLLVYLTAFVAVLAALLPVYWMVTISLKGEADQFALPPRWLSFEPTLAHYRDAFFARSFGRYLVTSALVAALSTACAMVLGTLAAYALARFRLPHDLGRRLSLWILSTRMFPPIVTAVPLFLLMRDVRLLNTVTALVIVYTAFNLPFVVWMMRGFFSEVPRELEEAALVDGDSRIGSLRRVVLPLAAPGLAATAIFSVIATYNDFLLALSFTQTPDAQTVPVGVSTLIGKIQIEWGPMAAAGVVGAAPIVAFALIVQRHFVRGLTLGAVK